jgi:transcriptional regulator with XRE-family HTH domain
VIDKQAIGKRILLIRKDLKINQILFASELGVTQQTISQIEGGTTAPSLEIIHNITSKYCISYEWLIDGIDSKRDNSNNSVLLKSESFESEITENEIITHLRKEIDEHKKAIAIKEATIKILNEE